MVGSNTVSEDGDRDLVAILPVEPDERMLERTPRSRVIHIHIPTPARALVLMPTLVDFFSCTVTRRPRNVHLSYPPLTLCCPPWYNFFLNGRTYMAQCTFLILLSSCMSAHSMAEINRCTLVRQYQLTYKNLYKNCTVNTSEMVSALIR